MMPGGQRKKVFSFLKIYDIMKCLSVMHVPDNVEIGGFL